MTTNVDFEFSYEDDEYLEIILVGMYRKYRIPITTIVKTHQKKGGCLEGSDVLKSWLKKNLDKPYPSKEQLAKFVESTGLTNIQINNWFSNARRRWPELKHKDLLKVKRVKTKTNTKNNHMIRFNRPRLM